MRGRIGCAGVLETSARHRHYGEKHETRHRPSTEANADATLPAVCGRDRKTTSGRNDNEDGAVATGVRRETCADVQMKGGDSGLREETKRRMSPTNVKTSRCEVARRKRRSGHVVQSCCR